MEDNGSDPKAILKQKLRDAMLKQQWQGNMPGQDVNIRESNEAAIGSASPSQAGMPVDNRQQEAQNDELLKAIRMKMIERDQMDAQQAQPQDSGIDPQQKAAVEAYLQKLKMSGKMRR